MENILIFKLVKGNHKAVSESTSSYHPPDMPMDYDQLDNVNDHEEEEESMQNTSFMPNLPSLDDPQRVEVSGQIYNIKMPFETDLEASHIMRHYDSNYIYNTLLNETGAKKDKYGMFRHPDHFHALYVKKGYGDKREFWRTRDYSADLRSSLKQSNKLKKLLRNEPYILQPKQYLQESINNPKELANFDLFRALHISRTNKIHRDVFGYKNGVFSNLQIVHAIDQSETDYNALKKLFMDKFLKLNLWGMAKRYPKLYKFI